MKSINIIAEIVKKVKVQDKLAMHHLYTTYVQEMLTLSYRITNNLSDAEDIVQESFLNSFQKINQLKKPERYPFWLKRMIINNSLKKIKKKIRFETLDFDTFETSEEKSNRYELLKFDLINEAIQELPDACRAVLTLYLLDDYKHKEIAALFDISVSTSKSQYRYGLKLLRNKLKKYIDD